MGADLVTDGDTIFGLLKFLSLTTSKMVFGGPGSMGTWIREHAARA